jgi:hypothetical protein
VSTSTPGHGFIQSRVRRLLIDGTLTNTHTTSRNDGRRGCQPSASQGCKGEATHADEERFGIAEHFDELADDRGSVNDLSLQRLNIVDLSMGPSVFRIAKMCAFWLRAGGPTSAIGVALYEPPRLIPQEVQISRLWPGRTASQFRGETGPP